MRRMARSAAKAPRTGAGGSSGDVGGSDASSASLDAPEKCAVKALDVRSEDWLGRRRWCVVRPGAV